MKSSTVRRLEKVTYLPGSGQAVPKRRFRFAYCLLIFAFLYFSVLFISQYRNLNQMKYTLQGLEEQISVVRGQNEKMLWEIEQLHTNSYIEKMARQELGMVRPGEVLFFFREEETP